MRISDWSSDVCSSDLGEVQDVVAAALGGEIVTTILQGRERFSAIVRYPRELRDDPHRIGNQVLVPVPGGAQVPLGELARIEVTKGAPKIGRASCRERVCQYV